MKKPRYPAFGAALLVLISLWHTSTPAAVWSQPTIDPGRWYRLSNAFLGEERALEIDTAAKNKPYMGRARDSAGQLWRFHPVKGGLFRITNKQVGEGMGLDIGREEGNAPVMAPTSDPRGQLWKITLSADGGWHLTNQVLGKGRVLDTYSDGANAPFMGETGDYTGQIWQFKAEGYVRATLVAKPTAVVQGSTSSSAKMSPVDYLKLTTGQGGSAQKGKTAPTGAGAAKPAPKDKGLAEQAYGSQQQLGKAAVGGQQHDKAALPGAPGANPAVPPGGVPEKAGKEAGAGQRTGPPATAAQIFDVDAAHFDEQVVEASKKRVVVAFFETPWCGNCKAMRPEFEEVVKSLGPSVAMAKIDADDNDALFWSVFSAIDSVSDNAGLPMTVLYQEGRIVRSLIGYLPKEEAGALIEPLLSGRAIHEEVAPAQGQSQTAAPAAAPSEPGAIESQVIAEINLVRTDPPGYAKKYLLPMRAHYNGKLYEVAGEVTIQTSEGVSALDECIKELLGTKPRGAVVHEPGLALAARDHVQDQGNTGATGHEGSDGSTTEDRVSRYGKWEGTLGENIDYGNGEASEIVTSLLIDDGVASRGHRKNLLNGAFNLVGIAVGPHKGYGEMCVMDFAGSYQ